MMPTTNNKPLPENEIRSSSPWLTYSQLGCSKCGGSGMDANENPCGLCAAKNIFRECLAKYRFCVANTGAIRPVPLSLCIESRPLYRVPTGYRASDYIADFEILGRRLQPIEAKLFHSRYVKDLPWRACVKGTGITTKERFFQLCYQIETKLGRIFEANGMRPQDYFVHSLKDVSVRAKPLAEPRREYQPIRPPLGKQHEPAPAPIVPVPVPVRPELPFKMPPNPASLAAWVRSQFGARSLDALCRDLNRWGLRPPIEKHNARLDPCKWHPTDLRTLLVENPRAQDKLTPRRPGQRPIQRVGISGTPGVCWDKQSKKWQVHIAGKYYGYFTDLDEACKVAKEKRALVEAPIPVPEEEAA
jgi:hypothetical protein